MASCELCGRKDAMYDCEIEGTRMKVCEDCSKFGKVKGSSSVRVVVAEKRVVQNQEPEYAFMQGYGLIVKNARERLGLKQEDFAKRINEHKSIVHQVESEHMKPSLELAKKFEKALHIKIVNQVVEEDSGSKKPSKSQAITKGNDPVTIGDMIQMKRR
jgi:putative transcription factor